MLYVAIQNLSYQESLTSQKQQYEILKVNLWRIADLNRWPLRCDRSALPTELIPLIDFEMRVLDLGLPNLKALEIAIALTFAHIHLY